MIVDKKSLNEYLKKDKFALGKTYNSPKIFSDEIWKYQITLRKYEYYLNTKSNFILLLYYKLKHHKMGIKLGFSIPPNTVGAGLRINHSGLIIINEYAKIGEFCDLNQGVNIGYSPSSIHEKYNKENVPKIGNCVFIGPGAKIFGGINIADNVIIGAGAVVNKSFYERGSTIAGNPAKIVSRKYQDESWTQARAFNYKRIEGINDK